MAQNSGSIQWQCDRCGASSSMTEPGLVPEGWLAGTGLHAPGDFAVMNDLCQNCSALPVSEAIKPVPAPEPEPV